MIDPGDVDVDCPDAPNGSWPATVVDRQRIFVSDRAPRREWRLAYRPTVPPLIAQRVPLLTAASVALAEEAARALRDTDAITLSPTTVPLLRSESAASSKVEHINVKQRYVARALAGMPVKQRAAWEVAHNLDAVQTALNTAGSPATPETIDAIHAALLPQQDWAGAVRDRQNWIGGSDHTPKGARHIPPAPERLAELVADLAAFINRTDLPPVVQAGIVHAQFETIHPYLDGNGRVGRALTHLTLRRRGVTVNAVAPLSIAFLGRRQEYLDALRTYEAGDLDGYMLHFSQAALVAARAARMLHGDLADLVAQWRQADVVAGARSDSVVHRIVADLIARPVTDAATTAARHGVARQTAAAALGALADAGILTRTRAARNQQVFEAQRVFAVIDGVEQAARDGELG